MTLHELKAESVGADSSHIISRSELREASRSLGPGSSCGGHVHHSLTAKWLSVLSMNVLRGSPTPQTTAWLILNSILASMLDIFFSLLLALLEELSFAYKWKSSITHIELRRKQVQKAANTLVWISVRKSPGIIFPSEAGSSYPFWLFFIPSWGLSTSPAPVSERLTLCAISAGFWQDSAWLLLQVCRGNYCTLDQDRV